MDSGIEELHAGTNAPGIKAMNCPVHFDWLPALRTSRRSPCIHPSTPIYLHDLHAVYRPSTIIHDPSTIPQGSWKRKKNLLEDLTIDPKHAIGTLGRPCRPATAVCSQEVCTSQTRDHNSGIIRMAHIPGRKWQNYQVFKLLH